MSNPNQAPLETSGGTADLQASRKRRILHVTSTLEDQGYIHLIWYFVRLMDPEKYEVFICCMWKGGPYIEKFENIGVKVMNLDMKNYFDVRSVPKLVRFIKDHRIDTVHTHIRLADWYGRICAKLAGVPHIFTTVHSEDYWRKDRKYLPYAVFDRATLAFATQIIAVSQATKDFLVKWQKVKSSRVSVIYPGIDTIKYSQTHGGVSVRRNLGFAGDMIIFGVVARLVRQKSLHTLLQAVPLVLQEATNFKVMIVGDGPLRKPLEELAEELSVKSHVLFAGFRTDVPAVLGAIDVFVMPSIVEGLCLAIVEAMLARKPVIASRIGGIDELIENNETGLLVQSENPEALAEAMLRLLNSSQQREVLAANAKAHALEKFSMERMVRQLEKFYESFA